VVRRPSNHVTGREGHADRQTDRSRGKEPMQILRMAKGGHISKEGQMRQISWDETQSDLNKSKDRQINRGERQTRS
jgi:hypothetical protein